MVYYTTISLPIQLLYARLEQGRTGSTAWLANVLAIDDKLSKVDKLCGGLDMSLEVALEEDLCVFMMCLLGTCPILKTS